MKANKMAAVRELLSSNPDITPIEIVAALAKQKIDISEGVASNYKSVIKAGAKRKKGRKARTPAIASAKQAETVAPATNAAAASNGSASHGLDPDVVGLLKAAQSLGWKKVQAITELMLDK